MSAGRRCTDLNDTGKHSRAWWRQVPGAFWTALLLVIGYTGNAVIEQWFSGQVKSRAIVTEAVLDQKLQNVVRDKDLEHAVEEINKTLSDRFAEIKQDIGVIASKSAREKAHGGS